MDKQTDRQIDFNSPSIFHILGKSGKNSALCDVKKAKTKEMTARLVIFLYSENLNGARTLLQLQKIMN